MKENFVFSDAEFSQCHASTIVETEHGLFMSCFAGPREGHKKTGIWGASFTNTGWCNQKQIVDSKQENGRRYPLWNPVLFSANEELRLYYRIGKSPENWSCAYVTSLDQAESWSNMTMMPSYVTGPVRNKPLLLQNGSIIIPTSTELGEWSIHFEICEYGKSNFKIVNVQHGKLNAIQPVILQHDNEVFQALCRTGNSYIAETWSYDNGQSWSQLTLTKIRNPNAAIDAIKINNYGFILVYNDCSFGRVNLTIAVSKDGRDWVNKQELENSLGEYSYPCMVSIQDGSLHILYTYNRKNIKHVHFTISEVNQMFESVS
jgi:predicted neuraminidase